MKRTLLAIALGMAAGCAFAQDPYDDEGPSLAPVVVEHVDVDRLIFACEPPNGGAECANFHELIRQNFTPHEIGMLFGGSTAYPEYRTSYDFTRARYLAFLQDLQDNGMPVPVSDDYYQ
jgi:hypothetical protein